MTLFTEAMRGASWSRLTLKPATGESAVSSQPVSTICFFQRFSLMKRPAALTM